MCRSKDIPWPACVPILYRRVRLGGSACLESPLMLQQSTSAHLPSKFMAAVLTLPWPSQQGLRCMHAGTSGPHRCKSCVAAAAGIQPVAGWKSFEEPVEQPASSQLVQRQSTGGDIWGSLPVSADTEEGAGLAGSSKQQAGMPREAGETHSRTPLRTPKRLAGHLT